VTANDWAALAVGAVLGLLGYAAAHTAKQWLRKVIAARVCPLCGCGCRASIPPERSFSDGVAQLIDQLDHQKEQQ
jgi:hypothetical protein